MKCWPSVAVGLSRRARPKYIWQTCGRKKSCDGARPPELQPATGPADPGEVEVILDATQDNTLKLEQTNLRDSRDSLCRQVKSQKYSLQRIHELIASS